MSESTGNRRLFQARGLGRVSRSVNSPNSSPNGTDSWRSYIQVAFTISIALLEQSLKAAESGAHGVPIKINGSSISPPLFHIDSGDGDSEFVTPIEDPPDYGGRSGRLTPLFSPIPPVSLSPRR